MSEVVIRRAEEGDLPAIIGLHEADTVGGHGDAWTPSSEAAYRAAFTALQGSGDHVCYVACRDGVVVGSFIVSILPGLTGRGARHSQLRSVQVDERLRSLGIGAAMVAFAEAAAREAGATVMELTSNLKRTRAHAFYERLGYAKSHAGFKKSLGQTSLD